MAAMVEIGARRRWMSILAQAGSDEIEAAWNALSDRPGYRVLRGPEVGLVMVRGRAGGTGVRFNLGEVTVTRCTVALDDDTIGHAYIRGRDARHAELAASRIVGPQGNCPSRRLIGSSPLTPAWFR